MSAQEYKPVPVAVAMTIAQTFDKDRVVIVCWDDAHDRVHVTTYGITALDKMKVARAGEICHRTVTSNQGDLRAYEDFRRDYDAARYRESLELLAIVRDIVDVVSPASQAARLDGLKTRLDAFLDAPKEPPCESPNNENSPP